MADSTLEAQPQRKPGLLVLANHGPVLFNGRPDGRPLKIAEVEFRNGLLCHAPSRVVVRLPGPGSRFSAVVGIDTHAGGGSVRFSVKVRGQAVFQSGYHVLWPAGNARCRWISGALREFTLEASDAGDGIACDHANWADAKVTLADGQRSAWLTCRCLTPVRFGAESLGPSFFICLRGQRF